MSSIPSLIYKYNFKVPQSQNILVFILLLAFSHKTSFNWKSFVLLQSHFSLFLHSDAQIEL